MLAILQMFHTYLPNSSDAAVGVDGQLFSGDQLTVERAVNVIAAVANGLTPQDHLDGIHLQLGDWHASVKVSILVYLNYSQVDLRHDGGPTIIIWYARHQMLQV